MAIKIDKEEFILNYGAENFNIIIKHNIIKEWFFIVSNSVPYSVKGTYHEACTSVKKYFKNNNQTNYGIIKLDKIEDLNQPTKEGK